MTSRPHDKRDSILKTLERQQKKILALAHAADSCQLNLRWFVAKKSPAIYFLDFDLICATLRHVEIGRWAQERSASSQNLQLHQSESSLFGLVGPETVRYILHNLDSFVLPPGTEIELLDWVRCLQGYLSEKGRGLLESFRTAVNSPTRLKKSCRRCQRIR